MTVTTPTTELQAAATRWAALGHHNMAVRAYQEALDNAIVSRASASVIAAITASLATAVTQTRNFSAKGGDGRAENVVFRG